MAGKRGDDPGVQILSRLVVEAARQSLLQRFNSTPHRGASDYQLYRMTLS